MDDCESVHAFMGWHITRTARIMVSKLPTSRAHGRDAYSPSGTCYLFCAAAAECEVVARSHQFIPNSPQ
jgi:hypothetical protein